MTNIKPLNVQCKSCAMSSAFWKLHLNEDQADVHFVFKLANGTFERVPAHKFLLKNVSSVFLAMFSGSWKENEEVEIVDASAAAFREFLQFFYFTDITLTMENALEVMNLVVKYDVDDSLITRSGLDDKICDKFVRDSLTVNNVCAAYEMSTRLNRGICQYFCERFISVNSKETFASEGFLQISRESLKCILKMDELNCSEADVLKALLDWIKARLEANYFTAENIRGQLGDLLHEIRFKQVTVEELASLSTLFSLDDLSQIIGSEDLNPTTISRNRKRTVEDDVKNLCDRLLTSRPSTPYYINAKETVTFSVNKAHWLIAFGCFLGVYRNGNYIQLENDLPCKITIVELQSGDLSKPEQNKIHHEQQVILRKENDEISFSKAIFVRPGFLYKIEMELTPPENCCAGATMKRLVEAGDDLDVMFYNDPTVNHTIRSVISSLIFTYHL